MAFTGNSMANSFKVEILNGIHAFSTSVIRAGTTADTFRMALYTSAATIDATTTVYSATNEVANSGSYDTAIPANQNLAVVTAPVIGNASGSGGTAYLSFTDKSWTTATITARGAMIYNATQGNKCVAVLDFGSDKISTAGTFTVQFPAAAYSTAIIRITSP